MFEVQNTDHKITFNSSNSNWSRNREANIFFLRALNNKLNHQLIKRGHLFLNEVFDDLGIPRTPDGAITGWYLKGDATDYIDFEIFTENMGAAPSVYAYLSGDVSELIFTLHTNGVMYDKI